MEQHFNLTLWSTLMVPAFFWAAYHYYKDRHRPEPILMLLVSTLLGYCAAYIGLALYQFLDIFNLRYDAYDLAEHSPQALFFFCIFAIGPIEEFAKFVPFVAIIIHTKHFDEKLDGVIYASFIALGFALHETRSYLPLLSDEVGMARAILAPIIHAMFASVWGYAYGFADQKRWNRFYVTSIGLLTAMFLHGLFDFFSIFISPWTHIIPPAILAIMWFWRMHVFRKQEIIHSTSISDVLPSDQPRPD